MFDHHKRVRGDAHLPRVARRASLPSSLGPSQTTPSPAPDSKNSDPATTPAQASSTDNNNTPSSSSTSASSSSSSSVPSSSSSSVSSSSSLSSSHSSSTSVTSSAVSSTSLFSNSLFTSPSPLTATRFSTGNSISLPTQSATGSSTPNTSGGTSTGLIVGAVAGTLAGIAVLGFLVMWCMRRQQSRDIDDFDAQAFKRQSAILVDDPVEPSRSYNPRPPTMIEHHNASPALATQASYGGQNFYGNYGGYGSQPPNAPMEMIPPTRSPPQAYGAPSMGYSGYDNPQQQLVRQPSDAEYAGYNSVTRQPSNAQYLTRQPSAAAGFASAAALPAPVDPNASYIDLNRSSVSPYQAAQYADISRQLGAADPNERVHGIPEEPLPSPFDDPIETTLAQNAASHSPFDAPAPVNVMHAPQSQGNSSGSHQRPATVYEESDAYGGI